MLYKFTIQISIVVLSILSQSLNCQNVISSCIYSIGDLIPTALGNVTETNTPNVGSAGLNQQWNLLNLIGNQSFKDTISTVTPASQAIFPGANMRKGENYYKTTAAGLEYVGNGGSPTATIRYTNPELILPANNSYGASVSDAFTFTAVIGFFTNWAVTGIVSHTVDGTGVIFTAGGSFYNAFRIKTTRNFVRTLNSAQSFTVNEIIYSWYQNGIHEPLLSLTSTQINSGPIATYFKYLDLGFNAVNLTDNFMNIEIWPSPNPAVDKVHLNGIVKPTPAKLMDVTGRTVLEDIITKDNSELNISELNPGVYYLILSEYGTNHKIVKL